MLFSLLLVMFLGQAPAAPAAPPTMVEARQLVDAGRYAEALAAFQAMAAVNPEDHQARVWIARLHERMGNDALAEAVFRSVLLESPDNVDAMVGVGRTLLARDELEEGLEVLERAERLAPRNDEVLAALGKAHRMAGGDRDAITFLERAYAAAPTEQHWVSLHDARLTYRHRVEVRGFNEQFNGATPDANGGEIAFNYRVRDSLRVNALAQVERKFGVRDERGGAGFAWTWTPNWTLHAQALVGPDNVVLPEGDFLGALALRTRDANWLLSYRHFDFAGGWVAAISPSVVWDVSNRAVIALGYSYSVSETGTFDRERGDSLFFRGAYRYWPRLWITAGYAHGIEDWDRFTVDRISDFSADTVTVGARFDLESLTSISVGYERQWRASDVTMGRVTLSLAQRF